MALKGLFHFALLLLISLGSCAPQSSSSTQESTIDTETSDDPEIAAPEGAASTIVFKDHTYLPNIRTVQLYPSELPLDYPIITLNSGQQLELHFDDLNQDLEQYYYRIYHCSSDWKKSDIIEMQYMEGFYSDIIDDYDMSFNTLTPYVHYSARFPNESMRLTVSGNYLLVVTKDDDESQPVLTKRFMVVQPKVLIESSVRQSNIADERRYKQLVNFEVHHPNFEIRNPFRDVKTVIVQNWRWDQAIDHLKPIFLRDRMLEYRYDDGNDFWAGNEFRQFNISSTRYVTEQVISVQRIGDRLVAELGRDRSRSLDGYRTVRDINGRYLVRNTEGFNDIIESDYVETQFSLDWYPPAEHANYYVFGALTDWELKPEFKLKYDYERKLYLCNPLIKQGYYEYKYVYLDQRHDLIDQIPIEGSYFETENEYQIFVYYRDLSLDYDQLIGIQSFSTRDRF